MFDFPVLVMLPDTLYRVANHRLQEFAVPDSVFNMPVEDIFHPFPDGRNDDLQPGFFALSHHVLVAKSVGAEKDLAVNAHHRSAGQFRVNERLEIRSSLTQDIIETFFLANATHDSAEVFVKHFVCRARPLFIWAAAPEGPLQVVNSHAALPGPAGKTRADF